MKNYFAINGVSCVSKGIICKELPAVTLAAPRTTYQTLPGRDGSLTIMERDAEDGIIYDDMQLSCLCYMADLSQLNAAAAFLQTAGHIAFPTRPGGHYIGRAINQIPIEQIMRGRSQREFTVIFRVAPFWYADNVATVHMTADSTITNPGNVHSEPVIEVTGSGNGVLVAGGHTVNITGMSGKIVLDCALKLAYTGTTLANSKVSVDDQWPRLAPGINTISITGGITAVDIKPNWRYR